MPTKKFLVDVDLALNQLVRAVVENRSSAPTSAKAGYIYFDTSTSKLRLCTVTGTPGTYVDLLSGPITSADITDGTIVNADINAAAAIALSKLATDPLARANHTGTQLAATVSDFDTQVRTSRLEQMGAPLSPVGMGGQRITSVADPISALDAANKNYVDTAITGMDWKSSVRVASTATVTVATPGTTLDGVTLATNDRVLLKDQATASQNGIYVFNGSATPLGRAADADAWAELVGAAVIVEQGTVNADTAWLSTVDSGGTIGTTAVAFTQFPGAGQIVAGFGLTRTGNQLDVGVGAGLLLAADTVSIDTALVARRKPFSIVGDATTTAFSLAHNLASTEAVDVTVWEADVSNIITAPIEVDVARTSDNAVTVTFNVAPASGAKFRALVIG